MATRNWTGLGGDNKATTAGNWDTAPATGDSVVVGFDSRGITWDIDPATVALVAVTFQGDAAASGNMTITLGHAETFTGALLIKSLHATNTVTLATSTYTLTCGAITLDTRGCLSQTGTAGNVTCTSFTQSGVGSVLTGKNDATFTLSGNFTKTNGTFTDFSVKIIFAADCVMSSNNGVNFYTTTVNSSCIVNLPSSDCYSGGSLFTNNGTVIIKAGFKFVIPSGMNYTNNGTISGPGSLWKFIQNANENWSPGSMTCPVRLYLSGGSASSNTLTLSGNFVCGDLTVNSDHATNTFTLATSTFTLQCGALTLDTRGCLSQTGTGGNVTCTSYTQSGTGSVLTGKTDATLSCTGAFLATAGSMTGPIKLNVSGGATFTVSNTPTASATITMLSNMLVGAMTLSSAHASNTTTIDLNGFNLSCNGLTVGTRGILLGKTGTINNSGNLDTSAGTFTAGTSTYITSSASSTLKLAAGGTIYNLIAKTSVITLGANATITKLYAHINPMVKGAYTLTLTDPTKEYTGMMRPIGLPLKKLDIGQVCAQCGWMRNLGALL